MPDGTRELRLVVTVPDYAAAVHFYRDVLGLRQEASFRDDNGGQATLLHAGRATIELADSAHAEAIDILEVGRPVAGPIRIAFEVADAHATADRLVAAGATLMAAPVVTPWGSRNARLTGPGGQQLTVWSPDIYLGSQQKLDGSVVLAEPDPAWGRDGATLVDAIRAGLGPAALMSAHVGSTSVPGLPAKPILDLVLGVADPADEPAYAPALEALGYVLHVREAEWYEHRLFVGTGRAVNLHVFAAGATEIDRMLAFRDHLRRDDTDRALYLKTKRELAAQTWAVTQDYADAKTDVVSQILHRAQSADPQPLRGCFVAVSGPATGPGASLARGLAPRLGLPLLSFGTVRKAHAVRPPGPGHDLVGLLLALAMDSGGAVLDLPTPQCRGVDLSGLDGQIITLAAEEDVERTAGETSQAGLDALARRVRQARADYRPPAGA